MDSRSHHHCAKSVSTFKSANTLVLGQSKATLDLPIFGFKKFYKGHETQALVACNCISNITAIIRPIFFKVDQFASIHHNEMNPKETLENNNDDVESACTYKFRQWS